MSAILYPVAANAERALSAPLGRAARESEAQALAQGGVAFVTEPAGPAFSSFEAAAKAFAGRIDDGRASVQPADRYCALREVLAEPLPRRAKGKRAKAVFRNGRRWSDPPADPPKTVWRLSVSYWRVIAAEEAAALEQAREARRKTGAELDAAKLKALAHQPLRAIKPQQPLDVGLFETPLPEAPHILIPDE